MRVPKLLLLFVFASVAALDSQARNCQLQINVAGLDKVPKDVRLDIFQNSRSIKRVKVRESGKVDISDVPAGDYELVVSSKDLAVASSRRLSIPAQTSDCREFFMVERVSNPAEKPAAPAAVDTAELALSGAARDLFHSAMHDIQNGKTAEAKQKFLSLVRDYPKLSRAYNNLGAIASQEGDLKSAAKYFERALQANPRNSSALLNLAKVSFQQNDFASVLALLTQFYREAPRSSEAYALKLATDQVLGRLDDIIVDVREIHSLPHTGLDQAHIIAADAYEKKGQIQEAIREYGMYLTETSDDGLRQKITARVNALAAKDGSVESARNRAREVGVPELLPADRFPIVYPLVGTPTPPRR